MFSQSLDRSRPLWEIWLVEGLADSRFALLFKTHHALVDGISGVDIATVLFDTSPDPAPVAPPEHEWVPRPLPSDAQLLADALLERATVPQEIARGMRAALRGPRQLAGRLGEALVGVGAMAWAGLAAAPPSPFNVRIGPHRRFTWVQSELAELKAIKHALGGTVNDVVLAAVTGALGTLHAPARTRDRRCDAEGNGPDVDPCRHRAGSARQPGRGNVRAAARWRGGSGRTAAEDPPRRCRASRNPGKRSALRSSRS